jgi:hypothetical protein
MLRPCNGVAMPAIDLQAYLFSDDAHPLALPLGRWIGESRRFAVFVETYRDKIRKKIRSMPDDQSLLDLRLELETAYRLLRESRFTVAYEPYRTQGRSPDFAVTFTTSSTFNVEATRLRPRNPTASQDDSQLSMSHVTLDLERLSDSICGKLRQLTPQMINLLVVGVHAMAISDGDLTAAMQRLKQRAEQRDPALFKRHGFQDPADFFRRYGRLSGVIVYAESCPAMLWLNSQATMALPAKIRTLVLHCFESSP